MYTNPTYKNPKRVREQDDYVRLKSDLKDIGAQESAPYNFFLKPRSFDPTGLTRLEERKQRVLIPHEELRAREQDDDRTYF